MDTLDPPGPARPPAAEWPADGAARTAIFDAKLRPPPSRPGTVERAALVDRLLARDSEPLLTLSAPPGYGKSTVLAQWAARQPRRLAWVTLDRDDNDPAVLLLETAIALSRIEAVEPSVVDALRSRTPSTSAALARLLPLDGGSEPVTVVLDHLEAIDNPESLDIVTGLAMRLPPGSRLAVATRSRLPLPTPLLRSRRDVVEVGVADLAMDRVEAGALLTAAGVRLDDAAIDRLVEQTEGWPAGLYLAALAANLGRPGVTFTFRGDDRLVGDYLRTEVFAQLSPSTVEFLTRTAVLDHLCGPLCDAVLARHGSQQVLESLEASNLLLVPLDGHREWYRYHRLFRDLLRSELRRREPDLVTELHGRAARWLEANRMSEAAIGHAQQASDPDGVARLVTTLAQPAYAAGRATTVRQWFDWFRTEEVIDRFPNIALLGALIESLQGRPASAERWAMEAERGTFESRLPDGSTIEGWRAYVNALACRHGTAQMRLDARAALAALGPGSALRGGARLFEGLSHLLEGDDDTADAVLTHAVDVSTDLGGFAAATVASAARALIAMSRLEWDDAAALVAGAVSLVDDQQLDAYLEASLAYVAAARLAVHDGDQATARDFVARAARLRPLLTYAVPCTAWFQLQLARTYLELADPDGARTVLRETREILRQRPDLGIVPGAVERLHAEVDAARHRSIGASSLTTAELRLLPYLPTHLSFPEIAERLYLSRHTVKTQAIAIYRKLGATSRSEAIRRAHDIGLLAS